MDGGSTDGTLEVLRRYPHLNVTSEKDRGLYDALNKAIRRARGEVVGHINSDDLYEPRVFGAVMRAFADHPEADAVVGGALMFEDTPSGAAVRQTFAPPTAPDFLRRATQGVIIDQRLVFPPAGLRQDRFLQPRLCHGRGPRFPAALLAGRRARSCR